MEIEEVRNILKLVCPNGKIDIPLRVWKSDRCNVWYESYRIGFVCKCKRTNRLSLTLFCKAPADKLYVKVYDIFNKIFELDLNELPSANWDYHVFILNYRN